MSTTSTISVLITALPTADTNGLPVLSYCLEIDADLDSTFAEVNGCSNDSMALTHLVRGLTLGATYGFRYKARNAYGWGGHSSTAYLKVATEPGRPSKSPVFVSATNTLLTITLDLQSMKSNGEIVTEFGLEVDKGSGFVPVVSYDGLSSQVTIAAIDESLVAGSIY